jgi:hypothetical protein
MIPNKPASSTTPDLPEPAKRAIRFRCRSTPLQRGPNPSSLARALAELGRIIKTLHVLQYCRDPHYRRTIHHLLNRGETRNSLARDIFHGHRGQLRKHYQAGQENQLDTLGIMINIMVLWQTVYTQTALDHLTANGHHPDPTDVARLSPLGHPTINLNGRYQTTTTHPPTSGLRPLRTPDDEPFRILFRSSSQAFSDSRCWMRSVAAFRRLSSEVSDARCLSGGTAEDVSGRGC